MTIAEVERAIAVIDSRPELAAFVGPRAEIVALAAERRLGLRLPPTYRRFLLELGAGNFGGSEIYGIIDVDFERSSVPDAVWATLLAREQNGLPADLVVIGIAGTRVTCLRVLPKGQEGPVLSIEASQGLEAGTRPAAADFGAYLLSVVEHELAPAGD